MTKHTTKTATVAVGAMLFDDCFDPIEDARARGGRFGYVAGNCL